MADLVLQKLIDESLIYQSTLLKYEQGVADKVLEILKIADAEMTAKLLAYSGKGTYTQAWLKSATEDLKASVYSGNGKAYLALVSELQELAQVVSEKEIKLMEAGMGDKPPKGSHIPQQWKNKIVENGPDFNFSFTRPSADQLIAIAESKPIQGAILSDWFAKIGGDKQLLVERAFRTGVVEGKTLEQIVQSLAGTKMGGYKDGVLNISRRHAEAVARTAVNNVSNQAAHMTLQANADIMKGWRFLATLDSRTTLICATLSGTVWPIGEGPVPPRHVRCRSFTLPEMKTWKELGFNFAEKGEGTRSSANGYVNADIKFSDWLKGQPKETQVEILGATRAKLFADGTLSLDKFADEYGRPFTIDDLKKQYPGPLSNIKGGGGNGPKLSNSLDGPIYKDFKGTFNTSLVHPALAVKPPTIPTDFSPIANNFPAGAVTTMTNKAKEALGAYQTLGLQGMTDVMGQYTNPIYLGKIKKALVSVGAPEEVIGGMDFLIGEHSAVFKAQQAVKKSALLAAQVAEKEAVTAATKIKNLEFLQSEYYNSMINQGYKKNYGLMQEAAKDLDGDEIEMASDKAKALADAYKEQLKSEYLNSMNNYLRKQEMPPLDLAKAVSDAFDQKVIQSMIAEVNDSLKFKVAKVDQEALLESMKTKYGKSGKSWANKVNEVLYLWENNDPQDVIYSLSNYNAPYLSKIKAAVSTVPKLPPDILKAIDDAIFQVKSQAAKAKMAAIEEGSVLVDKAADWVVDLPPIIPIIEQTEIQAAAKLEISQFNKIGGKLGSNEGGTYIHKITGEQWYIKIPAQAEIAQNEVMATQLYKLAGVDVTELQLIDFGGGNWGVASKWVEGLESSAVKLRSGKISGVTEGFGADAWLGNWDVVGLNYDNLKILNGVKAVRVDPGGALYYRAQGGLKDSFGSTVDEIKTLLNAERNPQSASVFGKMSQSQIEDSVSRILNISDADIRHTIEKSGGIWPSSKRKELADILIARKKNLAEQFPHLVKETPVPQTTRITQGDFSKVIGGRANGAAIRIDYGDIEDQQILFHVEKQKNSVDHVVGTMKIRGDAIGKMDAYIAKSGGKISGSADKIWSNPGLTQPLLDDLHDSILQAIKGISAQHGQLIRDKDIDRAKTAIGKLNDLFDKVKLAGGDVDPFYNHYGKWRETLDKVIKAGEGSPATWKFAQGELTKFNAPFTLKGAQVVELGEISFIPKAGTYTRSKIEKGFIVKGTIEDSLQVGSQNSFYEANIDGVIVRYWQKGSEDVAYAIQGRLQVIAEGASAEAMEKTLVALDKLGINVQMTTAAQAEEMYLRKIAYALNRNTFNEIDAMILGIPDPETRVQAWAKYMKAETGIDFQSLPDYNPEGKLEFWEQGQKIFLRPDLSGPEWDKFSQDHIISHQVWNGSNYPDKLDQILDGGGQLTSATDRVRRGIKWGNTSPDSDFVSGGSDYVFTRIRGISDDSHGFKWKPNNHLRRLDAISYKGDEYGRVVGSNGNESYVQNTRAANGIDTYKKMKNHSSNETIFKGGLNIFEDLIQLRVPDSEYLNALEVFRKHGWSTWPDGRKLTDVVVRASS